MKYIPKIEFVKEYTRGILKKKGLAPEKADYDGKRVTLYDPQILTVKDHKTKKMQVYVRHPTSGKIERVTFGHKDYSDYTLHRDKERRERYCARSAGIECDGEKCGLTSPNFWSRHVLWDC